MKKEIPTAEEFFFNYSVDSEYDNLSPNCKQEITYKAIEFTKLHVEAALKKASENVDILKQFECIDEDNNEEIYTYDVDKKTILNAYPGENIK